MQPLCHDYARNLGVFETAEEQTLAVPPDDWVWLYKRVASRTEPAVFDKLLHGPSVRGKERSKRPVKALDFEVDIYGATLLGITGMLPKLTMRQQEVVAAIGNHLEETSPGRSHERSKAHAGDRIQVPRQ